MSDRISDLLQEMQDVFGTGFGSSTELSERKPQPKNQPSKGGLLAKKKGGSLPTRKGKDGLTLKAKRALRKKGQEGEKRFQSAMKDIRGEMDKSHKKSLEKKKAAAEPSSSPASSSKSAPASGKSARRHFPFKRNANLGPGPRGSHHDETKCWKCKCGNIYSDGCNCVSSGNGENCPSKGTTKKISYNKSYKHDYNNQYHAWRAKQGGAVTRRLGSTR